VSLNPALEDVRFCPRCGAEATVAFPRSLTCPSCGYGAFYNPKPVAAVIPFDADGNVLLLRRAIDPGRGLWTFPGGFVDLGESVPDAARREAREELNIDVTVERLVGVYSRRDERVVLVVYTGRTQDAPVAGDEALEGRAFAPAAIPTGDLAFWSTRAALRDALGST